ncbi:unnamed protein product [Symbiodinium natans]|uniref:Sulfotransferase n=1 Tax=Symbiodinium natans TaxID=878477 RepID=A0A812RE33_9DINO|nr:unnamed protein product [Symbiodinium natans]
MQAPPALAVYKEAPSLGGSVGLLAGQILGLAVLLPPFACLLPFSMLGRILFGPDPTSPRISLVWLLMRRALFDPVVRNERGIVTRARTALSILMISMRSHSLWACCWYLDELYGCFGGWKSQQVTRPVFLISNARTGSSEFGERLCTAGKHLIGPNSLQCLMPYTWVWRLARGVFREAKEEDIAVKMREGYQKKFPEMFKRHPLQPFSPDTFEVAQNMTSLTFGYLNLLAGPNVPPYGADPDKAHLASDVRQLCRCVDALLKKTLHFYGRKERPFLKGHFIHAAETLAAQYPGALFVDVVREIEPMLRSQINFVHVLPCWEELGVQSVPWAWLRDHLLRANIDYCQQEIAFFKESVLRERRIVLRFEDCVKDPTGSLQQVFEAAGIEVLPEELSQAATRSAGAKSDRNYDIDVSLDQLQIPAGYLASTFNEWRQKMDKDS